MDFTASDVDALLREVNTLTTTVQLNAGATPFVPAFTPDVYNFAGAVPPPPPPPPPPTAPIPSLVALDEPDEEAEGAELESLSAELPVMAHQEEILEAVSNHRVVVLSADTGSGKSSRIPQFLLGKWPDARILVTQPRRLAAQKLAERVAEEQGCEVGDKVGFRLGRGGGKTSGATQITFATSGWVLEWLVHNLESFASDSSAPYTHVLLDEVHERDVETDLLCLVLRRLLSSNDSLRVVVMSATLDADLFARYFSKSAVLSAPVPMLHVGARRFPVDELYLEDVKRCATCVDVRRAADEVAAWNAEEAEFEAGGVEARPALIQAVYRLRGLPETARKTLQRASMAMEGWRPGSSRAPMTASEGDEPWCRAVAQAALAMGGPGECVLVFVAGYASMEGVLLALADEEVKQEVAEARRVQGVEPELPDDIRVTGMHSAFDTTDMERAWEPCATALRVVVATNIAESSLTIPGVTAVVDMGRHKEVRFDDRVGAPALQTHWIAQASARQRAGRAGRLQPGVVLRLFTRDFFQQGMQPFDLPAMLRLSLEQVVLRVKSLSLRDDEGRPLPTRQVLAESPQPPLPSAVDVAIRALEGMGALETNHRAGEAEGRLTRLGHVLSGFPGALRAGVLLNHACALNRLVDGVILASIATHGDPFFQPNPLDARTSSASDFVGPMAVVAAARLRFDNGTHSDHIAARNAYLAWRAVPRARRHHWCVSHGIFARRMGSLHVLIADTALRVVASLRRPSDRGHGGPLGTIIVPNPHEAQHQLRALASSDAPINPIALATSADELRVLLLLGLGDSLYVGSNRTKSQAPYEERLAKIAAHIPAPPPPPRVTKKSTETTKKSTESTKKSTETTKKSHKTTKKSHKTTKTSPSPPPPRIHVDQRSILGVGSPHVLDRSLANALDSSYPLPAVKGSGFIVSSMPHSVRSKQGILKAILPPWMHRFVADVKLVGADSIGLVFVPGPLAPAFPRGFDGTWAEAVAKSSHPLRLPDPELDSGPVTAALPRPSAPKSALKPKKDTVESEKPEEEDEEEETGKPPKDEEEDDEETGKPPKDEDDDESDESTVEGHGTRMARALLHGILPDPWEKEEDEETGGDEFGFADQFPAAQLARFLTVRSVKPVRGDVLFADGMELVSDEERAALRRAMEGPVGGKTSSSRASGGGGRPQSLGLGATTARFRGFGWPGRQEWVLRAMDTSCTEDGIPAHPSSHSPLAYVANLTRGTAAGSRQLFAVGSKLTFSDSHRQIRAHVGSLDLLWPNVSVLAIALLTLGRSPNADASISAISTTTPEEEEEEEDNDDNASEKSSSSSSSIDENLLMLRRFSFAQASTIFGRSISLEHAVLHPSHILEANRIRARLSLANSSAALVADPDLLPTILDLFRRVAELHAPAHLLDIVTPSSGTSSLDPGSWEEINALDTPHAVPVDPAVEPNPLFPPWNHSFDLDTTEIPPHEHIQTAWKAAAQRVLEDLQAQDQHEQEESDEEDDEERAHVVHPRHRGYHASIYRMLTVDEMVMLEGRYMYDDDDYDDYDDDYDYY